MITWKRRVTKGIDLDARIERVSKAALRVAQPITTAIKRRNRRLSHSLNDDPSTKGSIRVNSTPESSPDLQGYRSEPVNQPSAASAGCSRNFHDIVSIFIALPVHVAQQQSLWRCNEETRDNTSRPAILPLRRPLSRGYCRSTARKHNYGWFLFSPGHIFFFSFTSVSERRCFCCLLRAWPFLSAKACATISPSLLSFSLPASLRREKDTSYRSFFHHPKFLVFKSVV